MKFDADAFAERWRAQVVAADEGAAHAARARIDQLTKPVGSLGRIEELAVRLAAMHGAIPSHVFERRAVLVAAADHGVAADGVSAYPSDVTAQMVAAFLAEIAAINAFSRAVHAEVFVADFGVRTQSGAHPRLIDARCGAGTANLAHGDAIAHEDIGTVIGAGIAAFEELQRRVPFDVLALGEMGIGNTTSAAAIVAALTGRAPRDVVGRGTGIDDARLQRKIAVVEGALVRVGTTTWDRVASAVGGFEIVGLAGVMLAAARARVPIVLDGYIVSAAALIAAAIVPAVLDYCIAAHRSREPGHQIALDALGLQPLLSFDLALGEATGAALALPIIEAAARMMCEMRTFAEAGVSTQA